MFLPIAGLKVGHRFLSAVALLLVSLGTAIGGSAPAPPTVIVDNRPKPFATAHGFAANQADAQAFVTDDSPYKLAQVTARLIVPSGSNAVVVLQLRAHDAAKNKPGAVLEEWTGITIAGAVPQDYSVTSATGTALSANTQYWIVVRNASDQEIDWAQTNDTASGGVGTAGLLLTTTNFSASPTWKPATSPGIAQFAVTAQVVAPPLIAAADSGGAPQVTSFDSQTLATNQSFLAFDAGFLGGVRVAAADFDGDGVTDTVAGPGIGSGPHVKVFSGRDGATLKSFFAFDASVGGGVFVAAGDVNGDGVPDIVAGSGPGVTGGPVRIFNGKKDTALRAFLAYPNAQSGVRVAVADIDGDGFADIVTGPGSGLPPVVKVFSGKNGALLISFFAYDPSFIGGVYVAAGDVNGDGFPDIITGAGSGSAAVKAFSGRDLATLASFEAFPGFTGGVRVAAGDLNGDGAADIIVGAGPGASPHVKAFDGKTLGVLQDFFAFNQSFQGGVFVAGVNPPHLDTLTVAVEGSGSGKVSGRFIPTLTHTGAASASTTLQVHHGFQFELVAAPAKGSVFNGWTDASGQVVAFDAKSTFRMATGLSLTAHFAPDPFGGLEGDYDGLLLVDGAPGGYISAEIGKGGSFSADLRINNSTASIRKAQLLASGEFQRDFAFANIGKWRLSIALNMNPTGPARFTGTLAQWTVPGVTPHHATFTANREEFASTPCPFAGDYTLLLNRPVAPPNVFPGGVGALLVTVSEKGSAKLLGTLGDGTKVSSSFPLAADGTCPIFIPLYKGAGYLAGTIAFRDQPDSDIDGSLVWCKSATPTTFVYPELFQDTVTALGTEFAPPAGRLFLNPTGAGVLKLTAPAGQFKVGKQVVELPALASQDNVTLSDKNVFTVPADPRALKLTLKAKNGTFTGGFKEGVQGKTQSFSFTGVVLLPKGATPGQAAGVFIRGNRSGAVTVAP